MSFPNLAPLIPIYQNGIDNLLLQLGKPVKLFFKPTKIVVSEQDVDVLREEETLRPSYKTDVLETETENSIIIKGLLEFNPRDFIRLGERAQSDDQIVKIKTMLTDLPNLERAEYCVPDWHGDHSKRFKMFQTPIPQGLMESRYCVSFWKMAR